MGKNILPKGCGIDETSNRKGHTYITVIVNHDTNSVVWAHDGYGKEVLELFFKELTEEQRASIRVVTGDGAKWITDCVTEYCPNADRCVDPFHVVEWANDAIDSVRLDAWRRARIAWADLVEQEKAARKSGQDTSAAKARIKQAKAEIENAPRFCNYLFYMSRKLNHFDRCCRNCHVVRLRFRPRKCYTIHDF